MVEPGDEERLWSARRGLFFKPIVGYGGRGAYRGDKLTKRVWQDILAGDYVAQSIVLPGERLVDKLDCRRRLNIDPPGVRRKTWTGLCRKS